MSTVISADSHMFVLDENVLKYLPSELHEAYLGVVGPHRRPGLTPSEPGPGPAGEWDPVARLADMDLDGIRTEVLYIDPTGASMLYALDPDAGRTIVAAINSAALDFAAGRARSASSSCISCPSTASRETSDHAIAEVHRLGGRGARALQVPLYPEDQGLPNYMDPIYDPVWSAIEEAQMPISLHVCPPKGRGLGADPTPARGVVPGHAADLDVAADGRAHPQRGVSTPSRAARRARRVGAELDPVHARAPRHLLPQGGLEGSWHAEKLPSDYWYRNMAATFEEDPHRHGNA